MQVCEQSGFKGVVGATRVLTHVVGATRVLTHVAATAHTRRYQPHVGQP